MYGRNQDMKCKFIQQMIGDTSTTYYISKYFYKTRKNFTTQSQ